MKDFLLAAACLVIAGCQGGGAGDAPGTSPDGFTGIAGDEVITALGNEPFWSAEISGRQLIYATPENIDGTQLEIERFSGQGGLAFSGTLKGQSFDMTVTPGECSDTMSDRSYPYTVTLQIGNEQRNGCAFTDRQPFTGDATP